MDSFSVQFMVFVNQCRTAKQADTFWKVVIGFFPVSCAAFTFSDNDRAFLIRLYDILSSVVISMEDRGQLLRTQNFVVKKRLIKFENKAVS